MDVSVGESIFQDENIELNLEIILKPFYIGKVCNYIGAYLNQRNVCDTPFNKTIGYKKVSELLRNYDFEPPQPGVIDRDMPQAHYIFKRHENLEFLPARYFKKKFVLEDFIKDYKQINV